MNYFAHAIHFLDNPYFVAGTAVPDWLTVADRRVRLRRRHLAVARNAADPLLRCVAQGIEQHLDDDARFHESRAFVELLLATSAAAREFLHEPDGMRPAFLGHLLVEVLLDAALIAERPDLLNAYYELLERVDPWRVQEVVNQMLPEPTERLAGMIQAFCQQRILWDYVNDATLWKRLNQVMRRVGLAVLPEDFADFLPEARRLVDCRKVELMERPGPVVLP